MINSFTIPQELPALNEYVNEQRRNRFAGAKVKKQATYVCSMYAKAAMNRGLKVTGKIDIYVHWFVSSKRKDKDNIRFAIKFIQDGMMEAGLIDNDGWQQIGDYHDEFSVDKQNPRVEVELRTHEEQK
ncbi:hypothetical protein FD12_GL001571 [Lentilactobacillus rapi DSM 19907 = JCM 15042]|uniref:Endodeoxyribonuclease n=2 Tax=Lentilactobacillus rapi TaxID=481723 RepID=A0A512PLD2_9LACO|nr:RusA family crossover junction endodeoxyribonuclease [Lentilactobacillus rapi]KRL17645.1 hypothetical protein FD12_GL001571 [Lentilactobacillus rapi DSM 19907 = JCM 15042]GEP72000.1 endodeoxyribonuclease [Lentilactobacillus rapi]